MWWPSELTKRRPATLTERDFKTPPDIRVHLSNNFPTTHDDGTAAAIDPKIRVLQALSGKGKPIATIMNLAAHNQEIGHSDDPALQESFPFAADIKASLATAATRPLTPAYQNISIVISHAVSPPASINPERTEKSMAT